jgi:hypothetical protein
MSFFLSHFTHYSKVLIEDSSVQKKVFTINEEYEQLEDEESVDDLEVNTKKSTTSSTDSTESTDGTLQENIQLSDISLNIKQGEFI